MPKKRKKNILDTLLGLLRSLLRTTWQDVLGAWEYIRVPHLRKQLWQDILSFLEILFRRIGNERVLKESGSLTYITLLGFVPFIVFIVMIVPDLPFLNLKDKIYMTISNNFMPTSAMAVNNLIEGMLEKRASFNIFSFILLMISSYSLFRVIRDTFDRILRMEYHFKLDFLSQLIKFLGTIILGALIMVLMFSSTSMPLISRTLKLPYLRWMMYVLPFLMQFIGLVFLYLLMPSIKIKRGSLIRGAFWTTVIWVIAKSGFDFYIYQLTNFQAVYGVLAALPIFLMWIYVNWVIILGGIVLVSVIENRHTPEVSKKEPRRMVRLTLEMYSNSRLNEKLEKFISRDELKELSSTLEDEPDQ